MTTVLESSPVHVGCNSATFKENVESIGTEWLQMEVCLTDNIAVGAKLLGTSAFLGSPPGDRASHAVRIKRCTAESEWDQLYSPFLFWNTLSVSVPSCPLSRLACRLQNRWFILERSFFSSSDNASQFDITSGSIQQQPSCRCVMFHRSEQ